MEHYDEHSLDFAPTFPALDERRQSSRHRLPDVTRNYSDAMAYDSHGYIYSTMSGLSASKPASSIGTTIATEEIEFEYPEDGSSRTDDGLTASQGEPYTPSTSIYPVKKQHQHHNVPGKHHRQGQLLNTSSSMTSRTASTWLNETTYASTSLLDQDDGDSWSSASATTSTLLGDDDDNDHQDEEATTPTNYDDATTYMESPIHQAPIDLVESFLDELAENESVRRFGNFLLSSACQGRYSSDDDYDDDDHEDYDEYSQDEEDELTLTESQCQRGRSRTPRRYPPLGSSTMRSLQSLADSIFEVRRGRSREEPHGGTTRKKKKKDRRRPLQSFFACGSD